MTDNTTVSYYDLLDIDPDADAQAIRRAWRKAAKDDHPDRNNGVTSRRFIACRQAYETLIDPAKREAYDATLAGKSAHRPTAGQTRDRSASQTSDRHQKAGPAKTIPMPRVRFSGKSGPSAVGYQPQILRKELLQGPWRRIEIFRLTCRMVTLVAAAVTLGSIAVLNGAPGMPWGWPLLSALTLIPWSAVLAIGAISLFSAPGFGLLATVPIVAGTVLWMMPGNTLPAAIAAGVAAAAYIVWSRVTRRHPSIALSSVPPLRKDTAVYPIFGKPGQGLVDTFGRAGEIGALGERVTAAVLETQLLPFLPGLRIYHGLRMAPDTDADVDHALQYGAKVALIDTKVWAEGTYRVSDYAGDPSVLITAPDGSESIREVHLPTAAQAYRQLLGPTVEVRIFVIVHPPNATASLELINDERNEMRLGSAQDIVDEIACWMTSDADDVAVVNRHLMSAMLSMLK